MKTIAMRPDQALFQPLPSPVFANARALAIDLRSPSMSMYPDCCHFRPLHATEQQRTLQRLVMNLSQDLRRCYRKRIQWPAEEPSSLHQYYLDILVSPIVQLFSQLRAPSMLHPVQCKTSEIEDGVFIASFHSDDFHCREKPVARPTVIFTPYGSLDEVGTAPVLSSGLCRFLHRVWDIDPLARILCSDLDTIVIFHPLSSPTSCDVVYERCKLHRDPIRLRIIIAAYLYVALPKDMYARRQPARDLFDLMPEGPLIDPCTPMQTDKEVVSTHHRHSDFDFRTLTLDRDRGLQFFRWKEHIKNSISPIFASPGDVLHGMTSGYTRCNQVLSPCYPVENIPFETAEHIRLIHRSCPMGPMLESFLSSDKFTLRLVEDITPTAGGRLCRTYKCHIHSIGSEMKDASPVLCLKLFDDRFFPMETPDKEMIEAGVQWWWTRYRTAEHHVRNEDAAYKKLEFIQGSLIPYFYGSHSFTLPDGHQVYGILMEFVPAEPLSTGIAKVLSATQQEQLVRSTRHAIRALQCADVSQHDWHSGQIMCRVVCQNTDDPDSWQAHNVHCVLVDFSATTQSVEEEEHHMEGDFGSCLAVLMGNDLGLNPEIVWRNFGEREYWDLGMFSVIVGGERRYSRAADPYEFVYQEQDN